MAIYVVRHGETVWNRARRKQGRADSPLTQRGRAQAQAFGRLLRGTLGADPVCAFESSPLGRALETAEIVARELALGAERIRRSAFLAEIDVGRFESLDDEQAHALDPGAHAGVRGRRWTHAFPGGESLCQVHERLRSWLARAPRDRPVVAVTHGVASRALRGAYLGLSPPEIVALPSHSQDRVFRLSDGELRDMILEEPP